MNYSFEYIDIILLAMIAGFIFLRLRGILGKKTGHEENIRSTFAHDFETKKEEPRKIDEANFDEKAKADFLKGAKIAYESIITNFASGDLKKIKTAGALVMSPETNWKWQWCVLRAASNQFIAALSPEFNTAEGAQEWMKGETELIAK